MYLVGFELAFLACWRGRLELVWRFERRLEEVLEGVIKTGPGAVADGGGGGGDLRLHGNGGLDLVGRAALADGRDFFLTLRSRLRKKGCGGGPVVPVPRLGGSSSSSETSPS